MRIERQFAEVRASNEDRKVKFIFSTNAKDRHGTRINPKGWRLDNFNKNGVASYQHRAYSDPDPDMIIGKAQAWQSGEKLVGTIDFETEEVNPLAEKLYKKVKAGTLNAVSVGFMEHDGHWGRDEDRGTEDEEPDTYYFDDIELTEISLVSVPSNPEALAVRSFEATGIQKWVDKDKIEFRIDGRELYGTMSKTPVPEFTEKSQTDLTQQVINTNNMEKEEKKDLAPETSKVEHEFKLDTSGLKEAIVEGVKEGLKIAQPEPLPGPPAPDLTEKEVKDLRRYSIAAAIRKEMDAKQGKGKLDGIELEMHEEAMKESRDSGKQIVGLGIPALALRASLQTGTAAAGGATVATDLPGFIDTLKNAMPSLRAGATLMTGLNGDISIPKLSANSTASWRTEIGVATQSDPTFTAVTMTPHRVTTYTNYSQQLLRQTSVDVEAIVRNNLFYAVANALETAAMEGDGTSQVPTGILSAGVNDATHGSTAPTLASWTNIVNMMKMVAVDNALSARMAFLVKSTAAAQLLITKKDTYTGGFIWEGNGLGDGSISGYPAFVTNVFTNDSVIFGNWTELIYGQWGGLDLLVNPYSLDTYALVRVVIAGYYDVAVKHAESFARIDDLKLT